MPDHDDWSVEEVRNVVNDYMSMLQQEYAGLSYNKSEHRRALRARLDGRSDGSIEFKHQNISAALRDLGYFWVPGYLPKANYQKTLLPSVIKEWLQAHPEFEQLATQAAQLQTVTPEGINYAQLMVPPPTKADPAPNREVRDSPIHRPIRRDFAAIEAANRSLGLAGERLILEYERYRLSRLGLNHLADRVEHVAETQGDGTGFDILSFESSGRERYIEVKTTSFAKEVPFFASAAEVRFSEAQRDNFSLYRVFAFRRSPKFFQLPGPIGLHCELDPVTFRCYFLPTSATS